MRIQIHNPVQLTPVQLTKDTLTWVAPAVGIPALRYFQDRKEQRNELFVRDASTYSLGALIFLGIFFGGKAVLRRYESPLNQWIEKKWNRPALRLNSNKIELIAYLPALAANILYAGIGSVRLSQWFGSIQQSHRKPVPTNLAQPDFPVSTRFQHNPFQAGPGAVCWQG